MFIITAKCSKRRVVKILLIFALLLSLFLALRACLAFVSAARHRRRNK